MKFVFIPKADYRIGQKIKLPGGGQAVVTSYSHTGKNLIASPTTGPYKAILCVLTDAPPITERR